MDADRSVTTEILRVISIFVKDFQSRVAKFEEEKEKMQEKSHDVGGGAMTRLIKGNIRRIVLKLRIASSTLFHKEISMMSPTEIF